MSRTTDITIRKCMTCKCRVDSYWFFDPIEEMRYSSHFCRQYCFLLSILDILEFSVIKRLTISCLTASPSGFRGLNQSKYQYKKKVVTDHKDRGSRNLTCEFR